ncbi:MAG: zinc-binding dehydrogenase [Clostridia bacterium]|nr:zinc-binding dehydrogenase [Clostridia bacterium]
MGKMRAQRLYGPGDLRWMEIETPDLSENDVLIRVKYCGICGTDRAIYSGESSFWASGLIRTPMTMGHEYSGIVEAVGRKVTAFKPGDRVVGDMAVSCGICDSCRRGDYMACKKIRSVGTIHAYDGAYAEYTVMPERHTLALPDGISFKQGALVEPVAQALNSIRMSHIRFGENVLIIGTGPIGLGAIPFAVLSGAKKVMLAGRQDFKLELGKKFGADVVINTTKENLYENVMQLTDGDGPDVIIEASGSLDMLREAIDMVNYAGRIACVAFYEKEMDHIDIDHLIVREIRLIPVLGAPNMEPVAIKMMQSGKVDFTPMITQIVPLRDAEAALKGMSSNSSSRIKTMLEV